MRRSIRFAAWLAPLLALTGCGKDTDPGPGGVTQGEAKALDEAAQMLEQRPAPPTTDATLPAQSPTAPPTGG